mmetsp:Transcript_13215/g.22418  ORF Transcript_13215/g.22418 Transcript_13215/m.22418 type:complete len:131 (+) Transcript_13215:153-545(+)
MSPGGSAANLQSSVHKDMDVGRRLNNHTSIGLNNQSSNLWNGETSAGGDGSRLQLNNHDLRNQFRATKSNMIRVKQPKEGRAVMRNHSNFLAATDSFNNGDTSFSVVGHKLATDQSQKFPHLREIGSIQD